MFERLESLQRDIESSRLIAQGLPGWGGCFETWRSDLVARRAMRRPPRRRPDAAHHAYEDATASNAA